MTSAGRSSCSTSPAWNAAPSPGKHLKGLESFPDLERILILVVRGGQVQHLRDVDDSIISAFEQKIVDLSSPEADTMTQLCFPSILSVPLWLLAVEITEIVFLSVVVGAVAGQSQGSIQPSSNHLRLLCRRLLYLKHFRRQERFFLRCAACSYMVHEVRCKS